jgi:hypothetical protein
VEEENLVEEGKKEKEKTNRRARRRLRVVENSVAMQY